MIETLWQAASSVGQAFLILSTALFVVTAASLARLKSIGVLDFENKNTGKLAQAENILHSVFKLVLMTILIAGLARLVIAPDYPGGAFALDWPLLFSGLINFLSAIPSLGLVILLSRTMSDKQKNAGPALMAAAIILAVVSSGAGQILTAAAASGLSVMSILQNSHAYWLPAMLSGAILTAGVVAHFKLFKKLTTTKEFPLKTILADAGVAAFPTTLAIFLAAIAVSSRL